jgi:hypothetical protein
MSKAMMKKNLRFNRTLSLILHSWNQSIGSKRSRREIHQCSRTNSEMERSKDSIKKHMLVNRTTMRIKVHSTRKMGIQREKCTTLKINLISTMRGVGGLDWRISWECQILTTVDHASQGTWWSLNSFDVYEYWFCL